MGARVQSERPAHRRVELQLGTGGSWSASAGPKERDDPGEGLFQLFWGGVGISRNWATTHFLVLMVSLELSRHLWVCHLAC